MAGQNDILTFGLDPSANVLTQSAFAALAARTTGFQTGEARSAELNKVWRQSTFVAAGIAQWAANRNIDVLDNGSLASMVAVIQSAMNAMVTVSLTAGVDYTLNALSEANFPQIRLTGYINVATNVIVPTAVSAWTIINDTTGSAAVTIKTAAGAGVIVAHGQSSQVICDGTDARLVSSAQGFVAGDIKMSGSQSADPGWLICSGTAVSRTTYSDLFAAIGTSFGSGDGSTTFNIPDMRGVVPRGFDNGRGFDSGRAFGSYQADQVGDHTHTTTLHRRGLPGGATANEAYSISGGSTDMGTHDESTNAMGVGENRVKNLAVNFQIKY